MNRQQKQILTIASMAVILMSAPLEAQDSKPQLTGYSGGFFIKDQNELFELKINTRVQTRFTFESLDEGSDPREKKSNFSIPAARLKLKGHVFSKRVKYAFQTDFGKGSAYLKDFYGDFALVPKLLYLRVGQWVKPFSRQQITSSGSLELPGRAITDKAFGAGRDIGVAFHNNYKKSPPFEWVIGAFNGTGEKPWFKGKTKGAVTVDPATGEGEIIDGTTKGKFSNIPDKFNPSIVARVGVNIGKLKGYSEADLEGGGLRFGMGASGIFDLDFDNNKDGNIRAETDYIIKAGGFSSTGGLYMMTVQDGGTWSKQRFGAIGLHLQAGFVINKMIQPVVRYAMMDYKKILEDSGKFDTQEILGGLSVYIFKHKLKWQTDAGTILRNKDNGHTDFVLRTQMQLAF